MPNLNTIKTNRYLYLLFAFLFTILLILNSLMPLWGDDWWRVVQPSDFSNIFERINDEYFAWGGRITVLFFNYLTLLDYPGTLVVFSILNSLVFCLLLAAIFRGAIGRWPSSNLSDLFTIFSLFICIWFFTESFGEAILWKTGAIAYLWVITFSILVLVPFVDLLADKKVIDNSKTRLFIFPIAVFFLAIGLENVSVSLLLFMAFAFLIAWIKTIKLPLWYWLVAIGQLIGTAILLSAPGNFRRYDVQSAGLALYERFNGLLETIWQHFAIEMPVVYLFLLLISVMSFLKFEAPKIRLWLWLLIAIMLAFSMAGSTGINFQNRTAFVAEIAVLTAMSTLIFPLWQQAKNNWLVTLPAISVLLIIWGMDFAMVFEQYYATQQQQVRRAELHKAYSDNKIDKIYLPSIKVPGFDKLKDDIMDDRYFLRDIHEDKENNEWRNGSYAHYFGFKFAWRVNKSYLIFLPELVSNPNWQIHLISTDMIVFSRLEDFGYKTHRGLYLISPKKQCVLTFKTKTDDDKKELESVRQVATVNTLGNLDFSLCTSRMELNPQLPNITLKSSRFKELEIDFGVNKAIKQFPQFLQLSVNKVKNWGACKLHRHADTLIDPFFCSVSNTPKMKKGIMTFGPYYTIEPGQYRASIQYQSEGNSGSWDQVIQYNPGAEYITQKPLSDSDGRIKTIHHDFNVIRPGGKLEIRSYYNGIGKLKIFSVKLSALK